MDDLNDYERYLSDKEMTLLRGLLGVCEGHTFKEIDKIAKFLVAYVKDCSVFTIPQVAHGKE